MITSVGHQYNCIQSVGGCPNPILCQVAAFFGIQRHVAQVSSVLALARIGYGMFIQVHLCQGKTTTAPESHHTLQWLHLITRLQDITSSMNSSSLVHMCWRKLMNQFLKAHI